MAKHAAYAVVLCCFIAPAHAGEETAVKSFQYEWNKSYQTYLRLNADTKEKRSRESEPTWSYLRAQKALNTFGEYLTDAADAARTLIPATASKDRSIKNSAIRGLLQMTKQLNGLREDTDQEVDKYLHPPLVNPGFRF